jgi:rubrerythrin
MSYKEGMIPCEECGNWIYPDEECPFCGHKRRKNK